VHKRRKSFLRKWRLKCGPVADGLEEAGDKLFTFTRCRRANGNPCVPPTPSSASMRSFGGGSRHRPCCRPPKLRRCCFEPCSLQARSRCERWVDRKPSISPSQTKSLTSPRNGDKSKPARRPSGAISTTFAKPPEFGHYLERLMREIRRRTRVVWAFPDGQSCLILAAAKLKHVTGAKWSSRRYRDMTILAKCALEEHGTGADELTA